MNLTVDVSIVTIDVAGHWCIPPELSAHSEQTWPVSLYSLSGKQKDIALLLLPPVHDIYVKLEW